MKAMNVLLTSALVVALSWGACRAGESSSSIYGQELMSPQERQEYRDKFWNLKTDADRNRFRQRHHDRMQERAGYEGVTLPEDPWFMDRVPEWVRKESGSLEGEGEEGRKRWPEDGLRRWDPESQKSAFKHWPEEEPVREEKPDDGLRRWPDEKSQQHSSLRSQEQSAFGRPKGSRENDDR